MDRGAAKRRERKRTDGIRSGIRSVGQESGRSVGRSGIQLVGREFEFKKSRWFQFFEFEFKKVTLISAFGIGPTPAPGARPPAPGAPAPAPGAMFN